MSLSLADVELARVTFTSSHLPLPLVVGLAALLLVAVTAVTTFGWAGGI